MLIYVDFDDVICETARALADLAFALFHVRVPYPEIASFSLREAFHLSEEEYKTLMSAAHTPEFLRSLAATPSAIAVLKQLSKRAEVHVVTGRPPDTHDVSREWLDSRGLKEIQLFHCDKYNRWKAADKFCFAPEVCARYDVAIDDSPLSWPLLAAVPTLIIFDRPWNKQLPPPKNSARLNSWTEIRALLNAMV